MKIQRLRKKLEKSNDRLSIFANRKLLNKYRLNNFELCNIINDFLTNEQKSKLFEYEHFRKLNLRLTIDIINLIEDDKIKLKLLEDDELLLNMSPNLIWLVIETLQDNGKMQLLNNKEFLERYSIGSYYIKKIILSLSESKRIELLLDKDFLKNQLKLDENYDITKLVASLKDENKKSDIIDIYDFSPCFLTDILITCSDKYKEKTLIKNKYNFIEGSIIEVISSMDTNFLVSFFNKHNKYIEEKSIKPYQIIARLDSKKQLEFISKFEELNLSVQEKRQILAVLKQETKDKIDKSNFPEEYKIAFEVKFDEHIGRKVRVLLDLSGDLQKYHDLEKYHELDEIIYINPIRMSSREKEKLNKLLEIYPSARIHDDIDLTYSTLEEYKNGEEWIEAVIKGINPNWSDIQKIAYIDNAVGKKISYSPDYNTEISNKDNARALWKIIDTGYGVCNGISQVEFYMLKQIGIDVEMVDGIRHSFLKLKNIEVLNENGEYIKGNTILDPTWNLAAHRYGGEPSNFCKSYEEIRNEDIEEDGTDCLAHKNDERLSDCTLNIDDSTLRKIYSSIGIANKNGRFPIDSLIENSNLFYKINLPEGKNIEIQLACLEQYYPEFATCQNSTIAVLKDIILENEKFEYNKCVVNRVYEKEDKSKSPVLYIYVDFPKIGKKFYYTDKEEKHFISLSQEEFEEKFECYEMDMQENLKNYNCSRPWEAEKKETIIEDLNRSSKGEVATQKGGER